MTTVIPADLRDEFTPDRAYDPDYQQRLAEALGYSADEFGAAEDHVLGSVENARDDDELGTVDDLLDAVRSGMENWHDDPERDDPA